ncbi:hypothetical protein CYMTET_21028 [Cymbomonas tetramitiformis]|uniref:Uncharacterized protein n=1 Tax=Cymbomonas tetramitiformis TaxID=36881 RepID=A0AAE0G357_9CHLO|nr:hypothetical protein CYMTET_21028 [Cymbomonas tetramitiformis]
MDGLTFRSVTMNTIHIANTSSVVGSIVTRKPLCLPEMQKETKLMNPELQTIELQWHREMKAACAGAAIFLCVFLHPGISTLILQLFNCERVAFDAEDLQTQMCFAAAREALEARRSAFLWKRPALVALAECAGNEEGNEEGSVIMTRDGRLIKGVHCYEKKDVGDKGIITMAPVTMLDDPIYSKVNQFIVQMMLVVFKLTDGASGFVVGLVVFLLQIVLLTYAMTLIIPIFRPAFLGLIQKSMRMHKKLGHNYSANSMHRNEAVQRENETRNFVRNSISNPTFSDQYHQQSQPGTAPRGCAAEAQPPQPSKRASLTQQLMALQLQQPAAVLSQLPTALLNQQLTALQPHQQPAAESSQLPTALLTQQFVALQPQQPAAVLSQLLTTLLPQQPSTALLNQ